MMATMRAILSGEETGGAVLMRAASLSEAVCGHGWGDISADATQLVMAAKRLSGLFGSGCLVLGDVPDLISREGLSSSRVAVLVEAAGRLTAENDALPVICILPGPVALAAASGAESVSDEMKRDFTEAAEALCAAQPALVLFDESAAQEDNLGGMPARRIYNTLRNVAAYFDVKIGALLPAGAGGDVASRLKLDAVLIDAGGTESEDVALASGLEEGVITGFSLPADAGDRLAAIAAATGESAFLMSVKAEPDTTIDTMHAFMRAARDAQLL